MGQFNNKPKKVKSNGAYKAQRLKTRREVALENYKKRLALPDDEIKATAKRFRDRNFEEIDDKEMQAYRTFLKKEIKKLEKLTA